MATPLLPSRQPGAYTLPPLLALAGLLGAMLVIVVAFVAPGFAWMRWRAPAWIDVPRDRGAVALRTDDGVVLPGVVGFELAQPCSRPGPSNAVTTWTPTSADIAQLEADLAPFLASIEMRRDSAHTGVPLWQYRRQYAGLVLWTGERILYVNGFEPSILLSPRSTSLRPWRERVIDMCDGDEGFWGVEYDLTRRRFRGFAFNGRA